MIRDPELFKQLSVNAFAHFPNHRNFVTEDIDPLLGKALPFLRGDSWKCKKKLYKSISVIKIYIAAMRSTLGPCFTSKKLRQMFHLVNNVACQFTGSLKNELKNGNKNSFEFKDLSTKFAIDVIATCAYGLEVNSLKNPENIFCKMTETFEHIFSLSNIIKFIGIASVPKLMKTIKVRFLGREFQELFSDGIFEMIKHRQKNNIERPDLINLLMKIREKQESQSCGGERIWSDEHLSAQCLAFFIGGYATISTSMGFTAYEIACNSDVQQKLFEEILEMNEKLNGSEVTFDDINGMEYMDQVISESLRKWPSSPLTGRSCANAYDLKFDDKQIHFDENLDFLVPILSFHRDPKFFPEPDKFDPERFSKTNRKNIDPGNGRRCVGGSRQLFMFDSYSSHLCAIRKRPTPLYWIAICADGIENSFLPHAAQL